MSRVKKASYDTVSLMVDLVVVSKRRRKNEFLLQQKYAGGWLWIDGRRICKTKKGQWYGFHKLGGVVDHFYLIDGVSNLMEWKMALDPPEDWCEVCCDDGEEAF